MGLINSGSWSASRTVIATQQREEGEEADGEVGEEKVWVAVFFLSFFLSAEGWR